MVYILDENVYLKKNKYTFKEQTFWDKGRTFYCLTVANGDVIHGLLQSLIRLPKDEKDKAISKYLKNGKRLKSFDEYANAKPLIEITSYKVG